MRVFIAGATGVLGRRLVAECNDRGHDVVGLTRDTRGDHVVHDGGGTPHRGNLFDRESLREGAEDADAIVHAATKIPTDSDPADDAWALNDRVREEGAANLVATAGAVGADRFIQQSVVWLARQPDGSSFDETAEPHPDRSTQSALAAERIAEAGSEEHGFDSVILRGGYFYAPDAGHTRMFGERLIDRDLPIIGGGLLGRRDATLSFIHVDDAANAFAHATDGTATGCFHVVDDEPVTYATFIRTLADSLRAPPPRRIPAWITRFVIGTELVDLLSQPMPTSNDRFREAFDWTPRFPTYREGLEQVIETWRESGTIREHDGGYVWSDVAQDST